MHSGNGEYHRIAANGDHVMSYGVFKSLSVHAILSTLGYESKPKKGKTKKQRKQANEETKDNG